MSTFIELEIYALLNETGDSAQVAERLIQNLESSEDIRTPENIEGMAAYLWNGGFYATLFDFVLRHLDDESYPIPWAYFIDAIGIVTPTLSDDARTALKEGLVEEEAQEEAARSPAIDQLVDDGASWRQDRRYKIHKNFLRGKKNYLDQLVTLRTQQLYEQEKELLGLLQKLYPGDEDVRRELQDHKQRYALEILARRTPLSRSYTIEEDKLPADQQTVLSCITSALKNAVIENPEMAYDGAVAAWMLDAYPEALEILELAPESDAKNWFRLELLLLNRRFLELLQALAAVELHYAGEPETFFATAYLRAQAMWGMGQRHVAIEVLESLLSSKPHYRSGPSLLAQWRTQ